MDLSLVFFFVSIIGIFLSEVFTGYNRLELSSFLVMLAPFFLFLLAKIEKKKIVIPFKETIVYLIFLIFSIVSTVLAVDKEIAIKSLLVYISGYLFFVYSFNYQEDLKKYFKWFLVATSLFSCLIFFINSVFHLNLFLYGVSLFYNFGHYQIGNLLVLGVLAVFPNPLSILFFIFIIFSYSRTANISLIIIFILQLLKNKLNKKVALIGGLAIVVSLIFIVIKTNYLDRTNKRLVSGRDIYFSYAIDSIKEFPLFGLGPGNFVYTVIKRQVSNGNWTDQADNIFLHVLTENGVLAGVFFILFISLILYKHKENNNFLLFLALTLMFMSDLTYCFNFFLITWFILGGLVLDSKKEKEVDVIWPVVIVFIGVQIIIFSQILLKYGLWKQSLFIYPLQKRVYQIAIEENIILNNKQQAHSFLEKYDQIFGKSFSIYREIDYYQALGEKNKMAALYEQSLWFRSFVDINMLKRVWYFYIEFYGQSKADAKMSGILKQIKSSYPNKDRTSDFYKQIDSFCLKTDIGC